MVQRMAFAALLEARAWLESGRPALARVALADAERSLAAAERRREDLQRNPKPATQTPARIGLRMT
jgi:hypothetical protein